jgi:hypothetical protein
VRLLIVRDGKTLLDEQNVALFEVHDEVRRFPWYGQWVGAVRPSLHWTTEITADAE